MFGDYVSIYDLQDTVDDGATVPVYNESRLAKLDIDRKAIKALSNADPDDITGNRCKESVVAAGKKFHWPIFEALSSVYQSIQACSVADVTLDVLYAFDIPLCQSSTQSGSSKRGWPFLVATVIAVFGLLSVSDRIYDQNVDQIRQRPHAIKKNSEQGSWWAARRLLGIHFLNVFGRLPLFSY